MLKAEYRVYLNASAYVSDVFIRAT